MLEKQPGAVNRTPSALQTESTGSSLSRPASHARGCVLQEILRISVLLADRPPRNRAVRARPVYD
jgi:hypothetical protein